MKKGLRRIVKNVLFYMITVPTLLVFLIPLVWMYTTSLKTSAEALKIPPDILFTPRFDEYQALVSNYAFVNPLVNSVIVCVSSVALTILVGTPAAYVCSRFRFVGRRALLYLTLIAQVLPPIGALIPFFIMFKSLGLLDTHLALIITYLSIGVPSYTWLMLGYFKSIPRDLEEAALVDGCTEFGALVRITMPLAAPGIAALAILSMIGMWNEFMMASIITGVRARTMPVAIYQFMGVGKILDFAQVCAAGSIITLPVIIFSLVAQKYLRTGLARGAVKG